MEKKKNKIMEIAAEKGKNAAVFLSKTKDTIVKSVDQNDDGVFDFKDVSALADVIATNTKNAVVSVKENADLLTRKKELAQLKPIFSKDIEGADFMMTKLIRVAEIDKQHAESEVCRDSIGFISELKEMRVINIFKNDVNAFNLSFYPDTDSEIYYADPSDRDHYIALDSYFGYLKVVRVNELQRVAQDLGAKHFRVIYKEKKSKLADSSAKAKIGGKAKVGGSAEGEHHVHTTESTAVEIAAENIFPGHAPIEPKLYYLQNEPAVKNLIAMRMNELSPTQHESFSLSLINSSGIKEKDAMKIDAALKAMKISGNASITAEARNESCRFLEFEIDF